MSAAPWFRRAYRGGADTIHVFWGEEQPAGKAMVHGFGEPSQKAGCDEPMGIDYPVNVKAVFYMKTRRRVDLVNLEEALCDVLVKHGVLADDNSGIVAAMDGCRAAYDKANPRTEVWIERMG